ncbi:unnamed protein product [Peniophora sp. CBMAI 1063]|nr:unnamed protein product [Peniophora sp. CBMAI 1063]
MDDSLEQPQAHVKAPDPDREDADDASSGDEDGGLDWSKLPKANSAAKPVIPKRGEKDFEPTEGSGLQSHQLQRARTAMFDVLRATRSTTIKSTSFAVWHPTIARAHVTTARGGHFTTMGHSIARPTDIDPTKVHKRLELLPEEALYLVEKGALQCWRAVENLELKGDEPEGAMLGAPMSVQEAFSEMLGREDMTLERYQVYSYLKRLGYTVTRANPPSNAYPSSAPYPSLVTPHNGSSFLSRFVSHVISPFQRLFKSLFLPALDWWKPLAHRRWLHHNMDYASVYRSLRLIPAGHSVPLRSDPPPISSPYEVFYHLYKPPTPFKKTAPPPPDFCIVVVNARTTPIPTLTEFDKLLSEQPELPPPVPRYRKPPSQQPSNANTTTASKPSLFSRLLSWLPGRHTTPTDTPRRVNPFMSLRQGKRIVVVAAVDAGVASFFRFGQGTFEEWPMA